jgi:MFS family permease
VRANLRAIVWPPASPAESRNAWFLQEEVFWAAILTACANFGGNLAVRLGASNQLIGLMSSVPALLVMLLTLPAARWVESRRNRLPLIVSSLTAARVVFLLVALMPFVIREHRAEVFVGLIFLQQILLSPFNAGWSALLGDVVPERKRATIFARRNIIANAVVIVLVPLVGKLLDAFVFPYGYQIAYGLGFLAAMLSSQGVSMLTLPPSPVVTRQPGKRERLNLAALRRTLSENEGFVRITIGTFFFGWGAWLVGPLYIILYLRQLNASDGWVGTLTAVASLSAMVGYFFWQKGIARWGESRVLKSTIATGGIFPIAASFSPALTPILGAAAVDGLLMSGVNLSHFSILLKVCPRERRASYISLYTVIMNAGAFVAPLLGVALAELVGLRNVLLIGGAIRTLGGLLFLIWPVRLPKPAAEGA